ncbi:hypothetical protein LCGC14_0815510 [marine sediment metagenome]|uniref:Uncharacterized protein n=1 Tax=marine sediment metagenome TaxID=412755 RepID=A0A0F9S5D4_9ZZZZ
MTDATNKTAVATKFNTTYALKIVGNLGHDNKLFDRTCVQCHGAYSSYIVNTCPKCSAPLVYITTEDGKPMAISEGTIYLSQGPKTEARDRKAIANRKNGLTPTYRFKMFSFADENGVLGVPKDHQNMKSGAKVEVIVVNHQAIPCGPFVTKKFGQTIELMLLIYEDNGDTVKILRQAEADKVTTPVQVNTAGAVVPTDVASINAELVLLDQKIAALKKLANAVAQNPVVTTVPDNTVVDNGDTNGMMQAVADMEEPPLSPDESETDPFAAAS